MVQRYWLNCPSVKLKTLIFHLVQMENKMILGVRIFKHISVCAIVLLNECGLGYICILIFHSSVFSYKYIAIIA